MTINGWLLSIKRPKVYPVILALALLCAEPSCYQSPEVSCTVEHYTWRNASGGKYLFVEGVVSPKNVRRIYIQAYDAKDNFLGVASAPIMPGGIFETNIDHANPTTKLQIKYACS